MSHTTTSIHNVVAIAVSGVRTADNHRWQKIDMTMSDGSSHSLSIFLEPGALPISVVRPLEEIRKERMNMVPGNNITGNA